MIQQLNRATRTARAAGFDLYDAKCCGSANAWQGRPFAKRSARRAERRIGKALLAEHIDPPSSGSR